MTHISKHTFRASLFSLAAVLSLGACTDLDETAYDALTADQYLGNFSEKDIPGAIATVYSDLRQLYCGFGAHTGGCWLYTNEETGDTWVTPSRAGDWYDGGIYQRQNQHSWNIDDSYLLGIWRRAYASINTCNRLIFQFQEAQINSETKQKLFAEIRTARAFWYYTLCDMFGNVPLVLRYDVPTGFLPSTTPRPELFQFIIDELKECIPQLPDQKTYGRWDRYAATTLLAKMWLNAQAWIGQEHWQDALDCCDQVTASGLYHLDANFRNIFCTDNASSPEIIMAACNDEIFDADDPFCPHLWSHHWNAHYHYDTECFFWSGCCATPEFAKSYDPDDLRYAASWAETALFDNTGELTGTVGAPILCEKDPLDKGLQVEYTKDVPIYNPGRPEKMTGEGRGVRLAKYEMKKRAKSALENDFVLFRYADILFMKAEALWHLNGCQADGSICDLINSVRQRAFTSFTAAKQLRPSQLDADRFLMEYAWEFCQEGMRRQQLIRFDQFLTRKWFQHPGIGEDDHLLIFPIPRDERLANQNLLQNPGYPDL